MRSDDLKDIVNNHMRLLSTLPQTCERKKPYRSRKLAEIAMNKLIARRTQRSKGLCVYKCSLSDHFHIGHKPKAWYKRKYN